MSDRTLRRLAWSLYALILGIIGAGALLKGRLTPDDFFGIPFLAFSTMGAFVASRQPRNPIGWVFLFVGLRIQGFIDHRFYRRRYDARRTLESFSSRLRDTVDLDSLNRALVGAVGETMQPAHTSLWLRQERAS